MPGGVGGARSTMTGPYPDSGVRRASDSSVDSSFGCGQLRSPAGKSHRRRRRRWSPKRSEQGVARRLFASTEGTVRGLVVSLHGRRHFQHPDRIAFAQYAPIVLAGDGAAECPPHLRHIGREVVLRQSRLAAMDLRGSPRQVIGATPAFLLGPAWLRAPPCQGASRDSLHPNPHLASQPPPPSPKQAMELESAWSLARSGLPR